MGLQELYDAVVNLQEMLRIELHIGTDLIARPTMDYRHIKALAATYELQEYLANRIAATDENETEKPLDLDPLDRMMKLDPGEVWADLLHAEKAHSGKK